MKGRPSGFGLEDDLLYTKGRRLYMPKWGNIRRNLIKECHDTKWARHPGQRLTRALLESAYYWPQIRDEVEAYVRTCLVCQQDKVEQRQPRGLLEPLPIAERPWDTSTDCTAEETARLFLKHVVKYWGCLSSSSVIATALHWEVLDRALQAYGFELHSPQAFTTDGWADREGERFLELYLRHFATNKSPFELAHRAATGNPHTLTIGYTGRSPATFKFAKGWHEQADIARSYLDKAAKKMKKWAARSDDTRSTRTLPHTWEGRQVSYRVELPPRLKIHPVFHASYLKPYHRDKDDPSRGLSKRAPTAVVTSYDKEVEHVLADWVIRRRGVPPATEYLVKWKDYQKARLAGSQ
ncbi:Transposon Tf2-8 polyprotein [Vitis vinifera]|uniref:Transposon Tf2-8 polyprotein n=1 Tax=Vitis vinifera TaxID=29760 RepID=A0A438IVP0_VITVI|nr:Transposon Tf2-8 polyprotein [Vitis vinifera]